MFLITFNWTELIERERINGHNFAKNDPTAINKYHNNDSENANNYHVTYSSFTIIIISSSSSMSVDKSAYQTQSSGERKP